MSEHAGTRRAGQYFRFLSDAQLLRLYPPPWSSLPDRDQGEGNHDADPHV